ncbi:MAG: glycosyltransferase family 4 protein, partial [Candidatus Korarchaeota archaeon]
SILTDSGVSRKLLFSLLEENNNMLEVMGMKIFDLVSSVSKSYLNESVLALCRDVSSKAAHIYNGTDWKLEDLQQKLEKTLGKIVYNRIELRKHVLTKLLDLPSGEPKIHDEQLAKIAKNFVAPPYKEDLRVEPFDSDGPLVVITGRLSKQKGIDTLLDAFKLVVKKIPDAKLLMMVLPISGEEELIEYTMKRAIKMRKNVRCLLGVAPSIYVPAHIAADVYACPSRFEPFGIMALEGMACGVPVVATRTGGLQETVIDIRNDPFNATGLLSPVEDVDELANNLETILALSLILEKNDMAFAKLIPFEKIVKIIETTPDYYELLRKNCILRVEQNFTWTHAAKMAIDRYGLAIKNHSLVKGK